MPCYVRFHTREYLEELLDRDYNIFGNLQDHEVGDVLSGEMLQICDRQEWHEVACGMYSTDRFSCEGWNWYGRWVAEWSLDGTSPVLQEPNLEDLLSLAEPFVYKAKKVQEVSTRTITLEAVESSGMMCSLCFYKGHQCLTSECKRRYWRLIDTKDN